jgi:hypothetical protein
VSIIDYDYVTDYHKTIELIQNMTKYFDGDDSSASITDENNNITENFHMDLHRFVMGLSDMFNNNYFKFMYKNNLVIKYL